MQIKFCGLNKSEWRYIYFHLNGEQHNNNNKNQVIFMETFNNISSTIMAQNKEREVFIRYLPTYTPWKVKKKINFELSIDSSDSEFLFSSWFLSASKWITSRTMKADAKRRRSDAIQKREKSFLFPSSQAHFVLSKNISHDGHQPSTMWKIFISVFFRSLVLRTVHEKEIHQSHDSIRPQLLLLLHYVIVCSLHLQCSCLPVAESLNPRVCESAVQNRATLQRKISNLDLTLNQFQNKNLYRKKNHCIIGRLRVALQVPMNGCEWVKKNCC